MRDKSFYKKLLMIVLPIAAQNLLSALVSASDALMLGGLIELGVPYLQIAKKIL